MRPLSSRFRIPAIVLALGAPPCQETNPAFDRESSDTTIASASDDATSPSTNTTDIGDSTGTEPATIGDPSGTTLPIDPTTGGPTTGDPTTGDPSGDASSGTTGGSAGGAYPPCMAGDPPCPAPYDQCYDFLLPDFSVCSQTCASDDECPQPDAGTAVPVCAGPNDDLCVLDCGGGARCPAGMSCENVGGGNVRRCVWPA